MAAPPLVVYESPGEHSEPDRASNHDGEIYLPPNKEVERFYINIHCAPKRDSARKSMQPNCDLEVTGSEKRRKKWFGQPKHQ
jgi:hypothetical protein